MLRPRSKPHSVLVAWLVSFFWLAGIPVILAAQHGEGSTTVSSRRLERSDGAIVAVSGNKGASAAKPPQPTPPDGSVTPTPSPTAATPSPSTTTTATPSPTPTTTASSPTTSCSGTDVQPGDDLAALVNGAANMTFCIHAGTYDIGTQSLTPGSGTRLTGDRVAVSGSGAISAPTKIVGNGADGIITFSKPASGVVIENLDICCSGGTKSSSNNSTKKQGRGINGFTGNATGLTVRYSHIHGNANAAIGGVGDGAVIDHVELDGNGSDTYVGCCAGGIKSANSYTITNSYVHDNVGNGIWVDAGGSFVVTDNVVLNNTRNGIRYENSSGSAKILRNTVQGNNTSHEQTGAGIEVNSAVGAEIAFNSLGNNYSAGIFFRGSRGPLGGVVHDNVLNGDVVKGCDAGGVACHI